MAITKLQTNIIDRMSDIALQQLHLFKSYQSIVQYYSAESIATLTDADIQTLAELAHVSVVELTAAKNAMDTLLTAGGGFATGTVMTRLSKITKNLP